MDAVVVAMTVYLSADAMHAVARAADRTGLDADDVINKAIIAGADVIESGPIVGQ